MNKQDLKCPARGVVTRRCIDGSRQTLIFTANNSVCPLEGCRVGSFSLGPPVRLVDGSTGQPYPLGVDSCCSPVYDDASDCVYWTEGYAIMRMDSRNAVKLVAGSKTESGSADGSGAEARFPCFEFTSMLTTDGRGLLYVLGIDSDVRKITVADEGSARVSTLKVQGPDMLSIAYDKTHGVFLGALESELYRLRSDAGDTELRVELVAGQESAIGHKDGVRNDAAFYCSFPRMAVDEKGCAYMYGDSGGRLFKVDTKSGQVTTLLTDVAQGIRLPTVLPSGCLALHGYNESTLIILGGLGLEPSADTAATTSAQADPAAAFAQMLEGPLVTLKVGPRRIHAHREVLARGSDYFKGLFGEGFAEGGAQEVELPDIDPAAFAILLHAFYGGRPSVPDSLLRPVAELAGRLLASGVVAELTPRLLATTSPATVAADLAWAEQHSLTGLLPGLKSYFLSHAKEVMAAAPDSAARLVESSPQLAAEVLAVLARRS